MKNFKSIIAIIAISLSTVFSTNALDKEPTKISKLLRSEIANLLGNKISLEVKKSTTAEVSFMVNNKNEIVIISVDSNVQQFNSFVKTKLNYKKVNTKGVVKGEVYKMPVKLKSK